MQMPMTSKKNANRAAKPSYSRTSFSPSPIVPLSLSFSSDRSSSCAAPATATSPKYRAPAPPGAAATGSRSANWVAAMTSLHGRRRRVARHQRDRVRARRRCPLPEPGNRNRCDWRRESGRRNRCPRSCASRACSRGCAARRPAATAVPMRRMSPMRSSLSSTPCGGDVLAELAHRQNGAADLAAPELVVLERIAIDRLVDAAVRRQVGLAVADKIELLQGQRRVDRRFEDTGAKRHAPVGDEPWLADIQGHDFAVHADPLELPEKCTDRHERD